MSDNAAVARREIIMIQLREIAERIAQLPRMQDARDDLIREAVAAGVPSVQVAEAAGVSKGRVTQLAPRANGDTTVPGTPAEREPAEKKAPEHSRVMPTVDSVLGVDTVSGHASRRMTKPYGRRSTAWVDLSTGGMVGPVGGYSRTAGDQVADVLAKIDGSEITRVFLTGQPPTAAGEHGDAGVRAWCLADPGPGWAIAPAGHHLDSARTPTARYVHEATGRTVEIMRSAAWWGETDASPLVCRDAWWALEQAVQTEFGDTARLLATPATTGRDLWQRTIPAGKEYPVLSDEVRELIHATAGQGRIELLDGYEYRGGANGRAVRERRPVPAVHVRDGRLMYAALTWGMPVGAPTILTQQAVELMPWADVDRAVKGRSRWHVRVTVPKDWARPFGLLMAPRAGGDGWRYPADPGETFTTWCDGSELALARAQGWQDVTILGGITWKEGKPLNTWAEKLLSIYQAAEAKRHQDGTELDYVDRGETFRLVQRGVRSLLLFAVGAFASRSRTVTRAVPEDRPELVPAGARPSRAGDMLVWQEIERPTAWSRDLAHPEWSATIWARARVRMLDGPGVDGRTGALHLPPDIDVIAFRTDALVLTGDPEWRDDGKAGRLRPDGHLTGPFDWPETEGDMLRLKTAAQEAK